jgi:D-serine deaminase-like pyridoxal phosphate-dependent protein
MQEWFSIKNINEIDSPALVIYPSRVRKNIELLISMIDDVQRLRPHAKTHKTREAAQLMMDAGINKFKCATIAEAETLAAAGAPDVLLAYQPLGPKTDRFISLVKKYGSTRFSCLVDNVAAADQISKKTKEKGITIPVFIDLNVGMNRTGIASAEALDLYLHCSKSDGIDPVGLHAYDGHIHDSDLSIRKEEADGILKTVRNLQDELTRMGFNEPIIIAGGSPTFPVYAAQAKIECSPGTFVFWDASYEESLKEQPFLPAALVITRIISFPTPTTICTDLGHKSIAAENILEKRVRFINEPDLKPVSQSEEHLVLEAGPGHSYKLGQVLYGIPYHICPTCALYERASIVEEGNAKGEWKIVGRDRRISC